MDGVSVDGKLDGGTIQAPREFFCIVIVYAPTACHAREALFQRLSSVLPLHDRPIILGGYFNCTLNAQLDRSFSVSGGRHDSPSQRGLTDQTCVIDALEEALEQAADNRGYRYFYTRNRTYFYQLPTGGTASSRLDRWYINIQHTSLIRDLEQSVPGPIVDHNGVTVRIGAPSQTVTVRKPRRV